MQLQFTLFDRNGKYKSISTLINVESMKDFEENKKEYLKQALLKIRKQKGNIELKTLINQGYANYKVREEYNKEKIEQQNKIKRLQTIYENRKIKENKKNENI